MTQDLGSMYDKGDLCWMLVSTILCWYDRHQCMNCEHSN